jgi:hypothetical protein
MGKHKNLDQCKTWNDFGQYAEHNGIHHIRSSGGHDIKGNSRGCMPFSMHGHGDLPPGVRHSLAKQIMKLLGLLLLALIPIFCIIFAALAFQV